MIQIRRHFDQIRGSIICANFFFSSFFSIPFIIFALLFSLPPIIVVTQIRGHIAGRLFSPLPTTVRALHFLSREDFSSFFPRRLASNFDQIGRSIICAKLGPI